MTTARLFQNGGSQAVRLPRDCRFDGDSVFVHRQGNVVVLLPGNDPYRTMIDAAGTFDKDVFAGGRRQPAQKARKSFDG